VAYADFLTDKINLFRGHDKMDNHEKLLWSVLEQQPQRESGEKLVLLKEHLCWKYDRSLLLYELGNWITKLD
jgi:hypothetical protein